MHLKKFIEMKDEEFDISSLLKSKDFDALNTDEQAIIISEFGSREKYNELRKIILDQANSPDLLPPDAIRKNVMASFDAFHSKGKRKIGLWIPQRNWYRQPITLILAAASILIAVFLILPYGSDNLNRTKIAENKPLKKESAKTSSEKSDTAKAAANLDQKKDKATSLESENKPEEIKSEQQSFSQAKALKDTNEDAYILTKAEPVASSPVFKELQSAADEQSPLAKNTSQNDISSFQSDSNQDISVSNQSLAQDEALEKRSRSSEVDTMFEMELLSSKESRKAGRIQDFVEIKTDIFLISQPLPDHYVAY